MAIVNLRWGTLIRVCAPFRACCALVAITRDLVAAVCAQHLQSTERAAQIVMATHELLENLVKYSREDPSAMEFELCLEQQQPMCRISTRNAADARDVAEVERLLNRANGTGDAGALYDAMVASSRERERSTLGLLRICAEAGLTISCFARDREIHIVAKGPVQAKEATS